MKDLRGDQLSVIMLCLEKVVSPFFQEVMQRLDAIEERQGVGRPRMNLTTAAQLYDVNRSTLRIWCLRGDIPGAVKRGKS